MNVQTDASHFAPGSDRTIRNRRLDALTRAQRAREVLERETDLTHRFDTGPDDAATPAGTEPVRDRAPDIRATHDEDVERLVEIHRSLRHERHVARRPFHRRSERLVLAWELAERLALDRLGFADYAEFEASGGGERHTPEVVDLARIEQAQRELADAQDELAALDRAAASRDGSDAVGIIAGPGWTVDPALEARRSPGRARRNIFDVPKDFDPDGDDPLVPPATGDRLLDHSRPPLPNRRTGSATRRADHAAGAGSDLGEGSDKHGRASGEVLGEIVHEGRRITIEAVPGLGYDTGGGSSPLGPDSITYGNPAPEP